MARTERVVWDTGVIIGLLECKPERYPLIVPFVEDAEKGQLEIVVADTSVAELQGLRGLRDRGETADRARAIIRDFLSLPYVIRRPLHHKLADYAGETCGGCRLRWPWRHGRGFRGFTRSTVREITGD